MQIKKLYSTSNDMNGTLPSTNKATNFCNEVFFSWKMKIKKWGVYEIYSLVLMQMGTLFWKESSIQKLCALLRRERQK